MTDDFKLTEPGDTVLCFRVYSINDGEEKAIWGTFETTDLANEAKESYEKIDKSIAYIVRESTEVVQKCFRICFVQDGVEKELGTTYETYDLAAKVKDCYARKDESTTYLVKEGVTKLSPCYSTGGAR